MKKILTSISALSLVLVLVFSLTGCGETAAKSIDLNAVMNEISAKVQMPEETFALTRDDLQDYLNVDPALVKNFSVLLQSNGLGSELIMIEANSADDASAVASALNEHIEENRNTAKGYNAEWYSVLSDCSVNVNGNYVSLFAANNADEMVSVYNSFFD